MKIPIIAGATAIGKTEICVQLAKKLNAEIISVDSRQIYRYMDIGTAKPSPEERREVPHHLIDILDPDEDYNAYRYRMDALKKVDEILRRSKFPLLVGGTGLYVDVIMRGIFEGAPKSDRIRSKLRKFEERSPGSLRRMLEEVDPESAEKIHPNDMKRTIRALEVYFTTGRKISELKKLIEGDERFYLIIFERDRHELYDRINQRTELMIKKGFIDEVRSLLGMGYHKELNSLKTIGYRECVEYLEGKITMDEMIHLIKRNTRHFARRQIIWFRRYNDAIRLNLTGKKISEIVTELAAIINSRMGG
ncbi:MAG: tRNA (adenosine(37)-N6)-dimethylallyltransferase MiaA [Thermotogae bacterium]|nr:tRNA (adenosine(37)-N6)-dimethylallyltransferase MiaA [Thermotogota bacterium]